MMRVCAYVRKQHVREALCWDGDLPIVYVCAYETYRTNVWRAYEA